ncbi:MAG: hypothetical protein FWH15_02075 [Betaproteobacteria bacterium]|nr:hypothetical protein [Betaproteobacteria bacterium]
MPVAYYDGRENYGADRWAGIAWSVALYIVYTVSASSLPGKPIPEHVYREANPWPAKPRFQHD